MTMFMQSNMTVSGKLDEEFSRPVESIMRCEDFKSSFARKLSNRYISRPVLNTKHDGFFELHQAEKNCNERTEPNQLSKNVTEQNGEAVKPPDKPTKNADIRTTEAFALNIEVDTLRWQLTQTEANRQMHIALLKQIVTFLSRVKNHIERQKPETCKEKNSVKRSFNLADLPRSRSALQVNKRLEYSPSKKIYTRNISRSINDVNGFNDNIFGSHSKFVLSSETEATQKISEEMSRLITLANTVLSTKIPDLVCTCNDIELSAIRVSKTVDSDVVDENEFNASSNIMEENLSGLLLDTVHENENLHVFGNVDNNNIGTECRSVSEFVLSPLPLLCGLEDELIDINAFDKEVKKLEILKIKPSRSEPHSNDYKHLNQFIEDESGFSSMSSFQELGIPIINIIPPSPCKEVGNLKEMPKVNDETEKWNNSCIGEKQTLKVFWV